MSENKELALPTDLEAMMTTERYVGHDEGVTGAEGMTQEDIVMPRLSLVQKTSPQIDPSQPEYVPGFELGDLFNSLSMEKFGKGPVKFCILRRDNPRWMEFAPFEEGGGIIERDIKANDPRTQWTPDPGGDKSKDQKPVATKFYDYIVLVLNGLDMNNPAPNVMMMSLKGTSLKYAKKLNGYIMQRGAMLLPKGIYACSTKVESEGKLSWAVYTFQNAGRVVDGSALEKLVLEAANHWKDVKVKADETPEVLSPDAPDAPDAEREPAPF